MIFSFVPPEAPPPRTDRNRLAGTVSVDGVPAQRLVVVFNRATCTVVASVVPDPVSGKWEIKGLPEYPEKSLLVVALDNSETYNAEVADYVSQVPLEGT